MLGFASLLLASAALPSIDYIRGQAQLICAQPSTIGFKRGIDGSINGKLSLPKLLKLFPATQLRADGAAHYEDWSGMRQSDIRQALADRNQCVTSMYRLMFDRFYPANKANSFKGRRTRAPMHPSSTASHLMATTAGVSVTNSPGSIIAPNGGTNTIYNAPPREDRGLYQGANMVGRVYGGILDTSAKKISFDAISFTSFVDPSKPIEYKKMLLFCREAPIENPNRFMGRMSAVVGGGTCDVVGETK